ncbi:glycosyltransferase [Herbaspirillum rubrisubalbicans]|uniref:glycosyltransferase n=1 Tax=Herbaspirillum rubrisubalbicans TaxID=80842 RepID=UPI0020A693E9|nr:glycosyltransferase [Herbaspirillum rubrisubalbicans]
MNPSVLHVYRTYFPDPPGGLQEAIRQIALSTTMLGVSNTVFTLSPRPQPAVLQRPEATVVRCRSWAAPASCDLGGLAAFREFAARTQASDVVHYLFPWPFLDVLHGTVRPSCPAVLTYISDVVRQRWLNAVYGPLMWRTLKSMRVIVANAPAYASTSPVLSQPGIREKVRIIPLGIEESSYAKQGDDTILPRLGVQPDEPFFLFIGVLRYYKGLPFLIQAAAKLGAKVVIAGSGAELSSLRQYATQSGAHNVVFAGQVTEAEKVSLLQACQALVLPSHLRSEAYGMVLVEASMFGKPMISCEIGTGTSFVNAHEQTGIVVEPQSPEALHRAMHTLLTENGLGVRMGAAARLRYERFFSGPALGQAYLDVFKEVAQM